MKIVRKNAFTIVELLMCLAIFAVVMVAVGIALNASAMNFKANSDISSAVNKANQAISRMTAELRTATAVQPSEPNTQCTLITATGGDITYRFSLADKKLYLDNNANSQTNILCENIESAVFDRATAIANGVTYVKSVQIILTVSSGNFTKNACAAVVIRKSM